jgi:hypothetical protein
LKSNNLEHHQVDGKIKMNCKETGLYLRNSGCNVRQSLLSLRLEHVEFISRFFKRIYLAHKRRNVRPVFRTRGVRTSVATPATLTVCQGKSRGSRPKSLRPLPLPFICFPHDQSTSIAPSTLYNPILTTPYNKSFYIHIYIYIYIIYGGQN